MPLSVKFRGSVAPSTDALPQAKQLGLLRPATIALLLTALLPSLAFAQLPAARLSSIYPPGGKAGAKVEITIGGVDLDDCDRLWFSDARITATQKTTPPGEFDSAPTPVANVFEITIPAEIPAGAVELRAIGRFGVTNPRFFAISHQTETNEPGGNNAAKTALDLPLESILNARLDANAADFFRLNLLAGQSLAIETWAQRLDSRAEIYLTVFAPDGKEFARARYAEGRDPVLAITAPQDGAYLVRVQDAVFGGGAEHAYRISAHTRPVILAALPPIVQAGKRTTIDVLGYQLPGGASETNGLMRAKVVVRAPVDSASRRDVTFGGLMAARSAWVDAIAYHPGEEWKDAEPIPLLVSTLPVTPEAENPNPSPQPINDPCEIAGTFDSARDEDAYEFDALGGKAYSIEVQSNRLGWETDPTLVLERVTKDKDGKEQVQNLSRMDDEQGGGGRRQAALDLTSDDPTIEYTPPESMRIRIRVANQYADRGWKLPRPYRLRVAMKEPDFRMAVYPLTLGLQPNQMSAANTYLPRGGTATAQVAVDRLEGMRGEIRIRAEGLPAGVACQDIVIGEGQRNGVLTFIAAQDAPASVSQVRFIASAEIDGVLCEREARCIAITRGTDNRDADPGAYRVSRDFLVAVNDRVTLPAAGQLPAAPIIETSLGANLEIPVKVARQTDFKEPIAFSPLGLPGQVKPQPANLTAEQSEGKIIAPLNVANTRAGIYAVTPVGATKTKLARNPDAVGRAEAAQAAAQKKVEQITEEQKAAATAFEKAKADFAEAKRLADEAKAGANQDANVIAERDAKVATLDAAQKAAEAAMKAAQEKSTRVQQYKQAIDKQVGDLKNANQPKDMNFSVVSSPTLVRIHSSPVFVDQAPQQVTATINSQAEMAFKISRKFGFDGEIDASIELPTVKGVSVDAIKLAKDAAEGKFVIKAAADAAETEFPATLKLKAKFNNLDVTTQQAVTIKIIKPAPAQ